MAVLSVGSGKPYSTIAAAVAAQNGDTIEVQAGTYINDYVSISPIHLGNPGSDTLFFRRVQTDYSLACKEATGCLY
jgi:hypothetical protein